MINGERNQQHGDPHENFDCIADLWHSYTGYDFSATDIAVMMVLVKVSRLKQSESNMDNWIDICGYASCGGEIAHRIFNPAAVSTDEASHKK